MDSALFLAKKQENEAEMLRLREEKHRLADTGEWDTLIGHTKELLVVLEDGPERLVAFDAALFADLVQYIVIDTDAHAVFRLHGGLELREILVPR